MSTHPGDFIGDVLPCGLTFARQADRELGELALAAVDPDRAAMLLRDYVPADREPQTRPFAGLKNANAVLPTYYFSEAPNTAYVDL